MKNDDTESGRAFKPLVTGQLSIRFYFKLYSPVHFAEADISLSTETSQYYS